MKTTRHFVEDVPGYHKEAARLDWVEWVLNHPEEIAVQSDGLIRHWAFVMEAERYMRVVTLPDNETIVTAFYDRNYAARKRRGSV